ncbi:hypothetical protein [Stenomitos frigidus]|nr:hypothetical protein [Stenomitos frigidus]
MIRFHLLLLQKQSVVGVGWDDRLLVKRSLHDKTNLLDQFNLIHNPY